MNLGIFRGSHTTVVLLVAALLSCFVFATQSAQAAPGINQQMNFQGRLLNTQGATVPDGYYNVQFKIYQDGDGQTAGNTTGSPAGTLKWTESHLNSNSRGILVKNGFMSVELGSVTPFGTSIDWNQDKLWLSMNVGSVSTTCTPFANCNPDGEMLPMKRLSATPFSLNSQRLNGLTSEDFIKDGTELQNANIAIQSAAATDVAVLVQGATSQSADIFQVKSASASTPLLAVKSDGSVAIAPTVDSNRAVTIKSTAGNNTLAVDTLNGRVGINLAGDTTPNLAGSGLHVGGALRLDLSDANADLFITPLGSNVKTAINVPAYNLDQYSQVMAFGANSNAHSTARVLSLFDARTGDHQPTLSVFNPAEDKVGGFSWDGSNDIFSVKSTGTTISLKTDGATRATFDNTNSLYLGNGLTAAAPSNFTISGTNSNAATVAGGSVTLQGGNATVGNANGGNITLSGGTGVGTGANGLVVITTPTFSTTTNDPNCYTGGALVTSSCTISTTSVNNSAAVLVGFSQQGRTATLPNPTILTAGRVVYITAANGSTDFTLAVNGGGTGNLVAMRQNTSATMIWNGTAWTAAGASSSTTLQAAYDNTLQSAGGAELIVAKTGSTNGLTIRDSSTSPVDGTLLSVQTSSAASLFSINSNVTEYSTNGGAEIIGNGGDTTFPAGSWNTIGGASISRHTTAGNYIATGKGSVATTTTTAVNDGVKNRLNTALIPKTHYNVSFATRLASGTFTDMSVHYSVDGTVSSVPCTTNQAVTTSVWTKVNCTFTAPQSGITGDNAILIRQASSGTARTFYVDNLSVTIAADYNYASDGSVSDGANFANNWPAVNGANASRSTTAGYDASDSARVVTTGAGQGIRNRLAISPIASTLYRVTVYAASTTNGFNNFTIRYSPDGGNSYVNCADYNTQTVSGSLTDFTKVTCYITTGTTPSVNPYVYFTQTDSTGRTFHVDALSMTLSSSATPNVQIGGGVNGGPATLLTLDRSASAPIASNNDALLGSMYYDTTLGKLQCYEADGWGACGSSPDSVVTISPEYNNAVLHGNGVGTMVSDICSGPLDINDGTSGQPTICNANETYNFYKWTSPQATSQTYSIYVTYQLPNNFNGFASGQTSLMGRSDSSSATVNYQIYRNAPDTGMTPCGSAVTVSSGAVASWQTGIASGTADPSTCGFAPGNSVVFKINVSASQNASAYVGNLNFTFNNR